MAQQKWGTITLLIDGGRIPLYGPAEFYLAPSEIENGANEDGTMRLSERPMAQRAEFPIFLRAGLRIADLHNRDGDAVFYSPTNGRLIVFEDANFSVNGSLNSSTGEQASCRVVSDSVYERELSV